MRRAAICLFVAACGPAADTGDSAEVCDHEHLVTWDNGGEDFFLNWCRSCHTEEAADRHGAPDYLNYDTLDEIRAAEHNIRQAALWDQVMPPGYPLGDAEQETLAAFLDCGL